MDLLTEAPQATASPSRRTRLELAVMAVAGGIAIFVFGTPYFELAPTNDSATYNGVLVLLFGSVAYMLGRRPSAVAFARVSRLLFVAAVAMFSMVVGPFNWLVTERTGSVELAVQDKIAQFLAVVPPILLLSWAGRRSMASLYVQRGNLRRAFTVGGSAVVISAALITAIAMANGVEAGTLASLAPWILVFAALNAVMEELWFRGVFLRPFAEIMNPPLAIATTAVIFGFAHLSATYISPAAQLAFAALVIGLGAILALVIRWADTIWGAVLFHVGLDLVIIFEFIDLG